jgi:1-phosphofructokinase
MGTTACVETKTPLRGVCVFCPGLMLSVTVEGSSVGDEVHLHPAGQGYWTARAVERLGEASTLCAGLGGEVGDVVSAILRAQTNIGLVDVRHAGPSPAYVHDRRAGGRVELARAERPVLDRHTTDKLYSLTLAHAIGAGSCVLTGMDGAVLPDGVYRRLAADLRSLDVHVVTDIHGDPLDAVIGSGGADVVKLSEEDLQTSSPVRVDASGDAWFAAAVEHLAAQIERRDLVVTRGPDRPAVARLGGRWFGVSPPRLAPADTRGSGDAMAGALAVAHLRGLDAADTLRFAAAAGAASVTRRGLGSLDAVLVERLAGLVVVDERASLQDVLEIDGTSSSDS